MESSDFQSDPRRDATSSIRGYTYQAYQSILAWIRLEGNQILFLERSEDFDIESGHTVTAVQVKAEARRLTLRSEVAVETMNNFFRSQRLNPDYKIELRFLTTAEVGNESEDPFGDQKRGIDAWDEVSRGVGDFGRLKKFLLSIPLDNDLKAFIDQSPEAAVLDNFVRRIKWDTGNKSIEALERRLEDELVEFGLLRDVDPHESRHVLAHLLKIIWGQLATKGTKELTRADFLLEFEAATSVTISNREYRELLFAQSQIAKAGLGIDTSEQFRVDPAFLPPLPLVENGTERLDLVRRLAGVLLAEQVLFLHGSSGMGKSSLAALIADTTHLNWAWLGLRGLDRLQTRASLRGVVRRVCRQKSAEYVVLDDLDFAGLHAYEAELLVVLSAIRETGGLVVVTGSLPPPSTFLPKIWRSPSVVFPVPCFEVDEIEDLILRNGMTDPLRAKAWAKVITLSTSGHPQLVHARVRNLDIRGWPASDAVELLHPADISQVRLEARNRLLEEFSSPDTKAMVLRLSLIAGSFPRSIAIALATVEPQIDYPGESFDRLVGPWIEKEALDSYRVSPLIAGAGTSVLSYGKISEIHTCISRALLGLGTLDQKQASLAFFHAFVARDETILSTIASKLITLSSEEIHVLSDYLGWFLHIAMTKGARTFDKSANLEFLLRLLQYRLAVSQGDSTNLVMYLDRLEDALELQKESKGYDVSTFTAYSLVLNSTVAKIPSKTVIRMLEKLLPIQDRNKDLRPFLASLQQIGAGVLGAPLEPVGFFFLLHSMTISGTSDLSELFDLLASVSPKLRKVLLGVVEHDQDFAQMLVNNAWLEDSRHGALNVDEAVEIMNKGIATAKSTHARKLEIACTIAKSVLLDEYANQSERALEALSALLHRCPSDAGLLNQRSKVLFNLGEYSESLDISALVLDSGGIASVETCYVYRRSGICAARLGDWSEARRLFLLGSNCADSTVVQQTLGLGLLAEASFAAWKLGEYREFIRGFSAVLRRLGEVSVDSDIRVWTLSGVVQHCLARIELSLEGAKISAGYNEPFPGMFSIQQPNESVRELRFSGIEAAWDFLESIAKDLKLDPILMDRPRHESDRPRPLFLEVRHRLQEFRRAVELRDVANLVTITIRMVEGFQVLPNLTKQSDPTLEVGPVPSLPEGFWDSPENQAYFVCAILGVLVHMIDSSTAMVFPIDHWRSEILAIGALGPEVASLLGALVDRKTRSNPYCDAALGLLALRDGVVSPRELWITTFRTVDALKPILSSLETGLGELLIKRWIYAINNQAFAFQTPAIACREIEACLIPQRSPSSAVLASTLLASAPYLGFKLNPRTKSVLVGIVGDGG